MAALGELELGIDHIRNAFKRADNGFTNAYKMLEAEQQKNRNLEAENAKLRELVIRMRPTCIQGKRCTFADKLYICKTMEELGIEAD